MSDVEQSVLYMKVTEALREPGPQKLEDLAKTYNIADFPNLLYLAVGLSCLDTVRWVAKLYEAKQRDVNEKDPNTGNTALHEAVITGRTPIVVHLMQLPVVDDTIRNNKGLTALEVASTPEMEQALSASQNKFAEKIAVRLKRAFKARDVRELQSIYRNPRVSELMNINGCDPTTGRTVLHDAAAENDLQLVKFILAHGGDTLIKDRQTHKLAQDLTTNDEIRRLLITTAKSKAILDQTNKAQVLGSQEGPTMSGYLKKWTNITTGYKLRWFVLQKGWLSYYKSPEDVAHGERLIRGTLGLRHAIVRLDSSEKNRFEVRTPSVKFHLKATHQAECNKWVWALQSAITFVRDEDKRASKAKKAAALNANANTNLVPANAGNGTTTKVAVSAPISSTASTASPASPTSPKPTSPEVSSSKLESAKHTPAVSPDQSLAVAAPAAPAAAPVAATPAAPTTAPPAPPTAEPHAAEASASEVAPSAAIAATNAAVLRKKPSNLSKISVSSLPSSSPNSPAPGKIGSGSSRLSPSAAGLPILPTHHHTLHHRNPQSISSLNGTSTASIRSRAGSDNNEMFFNDLSQKGDYESDNYDDEDLDEQILSGPRITSESLVSRLNAIKTFLAFISTKTGDESMSDAVHTAQASIDVLCSDVSMFEKQANATKRLIQAEVEEGDRAQRTWAANYRDLEIQCEQLEGKLHDLRRKYHEERDEDEDDEFFDTVENQNQSDTESMTGSSAETNAREESTEPEKSQDGETQSKLGHHDHHDHHDHPDHPDHQDKNEGHQENSERHTENQGEEQREEEAEEGATGRDVNDNNNGDNNGDDKENKENKENGKDETEKEKEKEKEDEEEDKENESIITNSSGVPKSPTPAQQRVLDRILAEHSFSGYEDPPRQKLKIDADNRPKLSLWSILKNLIGKDMTKMTLPVTFNECTSLLQRSAEDMEYVDLLDRAAEAIDDPGLRMVYVAAFAGSSYSSTINRVAKPFNPLLGETYEYCRPDEGFRMFSEQVSHHPPIGALIAESPRWDFYGESNVESKFYGRSFDITPLGLWYLSLRPDKGADVEEELYSFRKLTSSVVGIMLGNPVVDNYGEMHIQNYTTGVHAVVNYKARGWRGSSAYKLQGKIYDKEDKLLWTLGGTWNDKMYAKKAGSEKPILIWQAHPRHKQPFNLTDFAITLNALPDRLKPWLPPTDTRLRPDQRAMEEGRYDDAKDDKYRVEEKQRAHRRYREERDIQYKPQWFEKAKHPITGEEYYKPINDYWHQRAEKELGDKGDIF